MTHDLWAALNGKILEYLSGISLADMVELQQKKGSNTVVFATRKAESETTIAA